MGLVKMNEVSAQEWEPSSNYDYHVIATLYVYCDKCGSFDIRARIGPTKAFLIAVTSLILAAITIAVFHLRETRCLILFLIYPTIAIVVAKMLWGNTNLFCAKCGSEPTLERNTLSYPSDPEILDVPDACIQKLYVEYCPDGTDWMTALASSKRK
jgi:hypothetical protein